MSRRSSSGGKEARANPGTHRADDYCCRPLVLFVFSPGESDCGEYCFIGRSRHPGWKSVDLTNVLFFLLCNHHQSVCRNSPLWDAQEYTRGDTDELEEGRFSTSIYGSRMSFCFCGSTWSAVGIFLSLRRLMTRRLPLSRPYGYRDWS